jgi:peptidoglycan/LPS O-acetylase OafA/YrhL
VPLIELSLKTLLAIIVAVSVTVTVALAAASYAAYKVRARRRRKPTVGPEPENLYFERYVPPGQTGGTGAPPL